MAEPGQIVNLRLTEKLMAEIEDFRYQERIPTRTKAILLLIERGLATAKKKETRPS